jgi:hypothetical protein
MLTFMLAPCTATPHTTVPLPPSRQVSSGGTHTMALASSGQQFIWGRASFGRLGLASDKDCYSPVECLLPGGHGRWRIVCVAAGGRHSMCLAVPVRESEWRLAVVCGLWGGVGCQGGCCCQ